MKKNPNFLETVFKETGPYFKISLTPCSNNTASYAAGIQTLGCCNEVSDIHHNSTELHVAKWEVALCGK